VPRTPLFPFLAAALLACAEAPEAPPRPLNVVVITLDTTRADALGTYGQSLPVTPRIDAMAAEGLLFEQVVAATPSTLPSHATLFTGREPYAHGARSNIGYRLSPENATLAELLAERGWRSAAEIAAPVLAADRGLDQGFAAYGEAKVPVLDAAEQLDEHRLLRYRRSAEEITGAGLAFLRAHAGEPFLLWLHYFDPHIPHAPPDPFASRFADAYLAEVSRVDHEVGRVLDALVELGLRERTLVVLTADHGEGRGEHGEDTHAFFVYDSTLRVPLVFWGADLVPRGARVASLVRLADVTPTLLDLLGLPPLAGAQGVSLRPLFSDPTRDLGLAAYSESIEWRIAFGGDVLRALREDGWKYVHKLEPELFHVAEDPGETRNLAGREPERVARLRARLAELLASAPPAPGDAAARVDPEALARLRALGYVGGETSAQDAGPLDDLALAGPDPARRVEDLRAYNLALARLGDGQAAPAERLYRWLWRRYPQSPSVLSGLIETQLQLGHEEEAIALLRRALDLEPGAVGQRQRLARVLLRRGESEEAERLLREALALDPCLGLTRFHLSHVLHRRQRYAEQIAVLEGAPAQCAASPEVDNALAFALATAPDAGLRDGRRAVSLAQAVVEESGAQHPDYLDTLAAAWAEVGDFERAVAEQRRALALVEGRDLPPGLVEPLRRHLELFEAGEPLREP
jgi:arylsulfatase A-like enzyme